MLIVKLPLADGVKGERQELEARASVELVLELDPGREGRLVRKAGLSQELEISK